MIAKTILALAQAHRKEPSRANYKALADAVRKLDAELAGTNAVNKAAALEIVKLTAEIAKYKELLS